VKDPFEFIDQQPIKETVKKKVRAFVTDIVHDVEFDLIDELVFGLCHAFGKITEGAAKAETHLLLDRIDQHSKRYVEQSGLTVKEHIAL
jgi:hypothetical protein